MLRQPPQQGDAAAIVVVVAYYSHAKLISIIRATLCDQPPYYIMVFVACSLNDYFVTVIISLIALLTQVLTDFQVAL
jgi:hypothetical protein